MQEYPVGLRYATVRLQDCPFCDELVYINLS